MMRTRKFCVWIGLASLTVFTARPAARAEDVEHPFGTIQTFIFNYAGAVTGLPPGQQARVWLPVAETNPEQDVVIVNQSLPADALQGRDAKAGNAMLSFTATAGADGKVPFAVQYRVTRREATATPAVPNDSGDNYRSADALVPLGGKAEELIAGRTLPAEPMARARTLFDVVDDAMEYRKDKPGWGRGDVNWACDSRFGNCTDFESVFIALARNHDLPTKLEFGFRLPEGKAAGDVPGYHCWAKFLADGKWVPIDISEAHNEPPHKGYYFGRLGPNRVTFSTGRDLTLVPKQAGPPLNYFVNPYAEVDGKPLPRFEMHYTFENVK